MNTLYDLVSQWQRLCKIAPGFDGWGSAERGPRAGTGQFFLCQNVVVKKTNKKFVITNGAF